MALNLAALDLKNLNADRPDTKRNPVATARTDALMSSGTAMVTLRVGPELEDFAIHKELIAALSSFFKAAYESSMIEGQTQSMILEDVEVAVFREVKYWLYTGKIANEENYIYKTHLSISGVSSTSNPLPKVGKRIQRLLAAGKLEVDRIHLYKVWELGRRFLMPALQDQVFALLVMSPWISTTDLTGVKEVVKAANFLSGEEFRGTKIARFLVKSLTARSCTGSREWNDMMDTLPETIVTEVLIDIAKWRGRRVIEDADYIFLNMMY